MGQPFVGEIRMFAGTFAPSGWAFCDGQLLAISDNDALFALIGTTYGGDGQSTFALPDTRGRIPIHQGNGFTLAENGGAEAVTLTTQQIPAHSHAAVGAAVTGDQTSAANALPANSVTITPYLNTAPDAAFNAAAIAPVGASQPHANFQPYLCMNYIISLFGLFPPQN